MASNVDKADSVTVTAQQQSEAASSIELNQVQQKSIYISSFWSETLQDTTLFNRYGKESALLNKQ